MSVGVAAILLCIFGVPGETESSPHLYPSVDDAIRYIRYGGELIVAPEEE